MFLAMLLKAAGEREREKMPTKVLYLSLTVLVIELRYLYLGTHLIPEVVGTRYT